MKRLTVGELQKGDEVWVETQYGEFVLCAVRLVWQTKLATERQRFSKTTGWELVHITTRDELMYQKRYRNRIHNGDGVLYTDEYVKRFTARQQSTVIQTELIYSLLDLSPVLWRRLSIEQLKQVKDWIDGT